MKSIGIFCIKRVCAGRRLPQNVNSTLSSHLSQTQIMILVPSTVNPALRSLKRNNHPSWLIFVWLLHLIKLCTTPVFFPPILSPRRDLIKLPISFDYEKNKTKSGFTELQTAAGCLSLSTHPDLLLKRRLLKVSSDGLFREGVHTFRLPWIDRVSAGVRWCDLRRGTSYVTAHMQTIKAQSCF